MKKEMIIAAIMLATTHSDAGFLTKKKNSIPAQPQQSAQQAQVPIEYTPDNKVTADAAAVELFSEISNSISGIQLKLKSGQTAEALTLSKSLLDKTRTQLGIDPKVQVTKPIIVKGVIPENVNKISELNPQAKEAVFMAIKNAKSGIYLDLINGIKRVNLVYLKAVYQSAKENGGIRDSDIAKIKGDLSKIYNFQIQVMDSDSKAKISLTDSSVAQSDQLYFFNREIDDFELETPEIRFQKNTVISGNAVYTHPLYVACQNHFTQYSTYDSPTFTSHFLSPYCKAMAEAGKDIKEPNTAACITNETQSYLRLREGNHYFVHPDNFYRVFRAILKCLDMSVEQ